MTAPRPTPEREAMYRTWGVPLFDECFAEIDALRAERDAQAQRIADLERGLWPFARFWAAWQAKPLPGIHDEVYSIHLGTRYEAVLRLTDCRRAAELAPQPAEETGHAE